ncbi:hypothetical protein K456DRAFT_50013 [Colletotrichum gloeosporioides 23]|nr:hypothetical protein K456DRAFT_50013 [Colletotrichum gloeosporioides 23]
MDRPSVSFGPCFEILLLLCCLVRREMGEEREREGEKASIIWTRCSWRTLRLESEERPRESCGGGLSACFLNEGG